MKAPRVPAMLRVADAGAIVGWVVATTAGRIFPGTFTPSEAVARQSAAAVAVLNQLNPATVAVCQAKLVVSREGARLATSDADLKRKIPAIRRSADAVKDRRW